MIRGALTAMAWLVLGCSGDPAGFDALPVRFETAHFRYHAEPERWICPRFGDWLDHDYEARTAWLDDTLPSGHKIDYYLLPNLAAVGDTCGRPHGAIPSGCVLGTNVFTWQAYHPHELVHAYAALLGGSGPPLFFNEGLAVMLGGGAGGMVDRSIPVESLIETREFVQIQEPAFSALYGAAGAFSRFLLDRHGRDSYLAFYRSVPRGASGEAIRAGFQSAFDESLDVALAAWRAGPDVTEEDFRIHLTECGMPPIEGPIADLDGVACGTMDALYPLGVIRSLSLPAPSGVIVRLRSPRVIRAELRACAGRLVSERTLFTFKPTQLGLTRELWTDLQAGDYWLEVAAQGADGEETGDAAVSLERTQPVIADLCAAAPDRGIAPDTAEVVIAGTFEGASDDAPIDGRVDVSARFHVAEARLAATTSFAPSDIDQVALCVASCPGDAAPNCPVKIGGATLQPDVTHTLTFAGTPGAFGYQFGLQLLPSN